MTELDRFLAGVYDALAEAEMQAMQHGQRRLKQAIEEEAVPEDARLPVYHATDVQVRLKVGLEAEETDETAEIFVTSWQDDDVPALSFDVEVYDLLGRKDLSQIEVGDVPAGVDAEEVEHRIGLTEPTFEEREEEAEEKSEAEAEGENEAEREDERPAEREESKDTGDEPEENA